MTTPPQPGLDQSKYQDKQKEVAFFDGHAAADSL